MLGAYPKIGHDSSLPYPFQFILNSPKPSDDTQRIGFQRVQSVTEERVDLPLMFTQFLTIRLTERRNGKRIMISDQERPILISALPQ
jgi:hypothetical protein